MWISVRPWHRKLAVPVLSMLLLGLCHCSNPKDPQAQRATQKKEAQKAAQELAPLKKDDPLAAEKLKSLDVALNELRKYKLALFARFEQSPDGEVTAVLNPGINEGGQSKWAQRAILPQGRGIPLVDIKASLNLKPFVKGTGRALFGVEEVGGWKVRKLIFDGVRYIVPYVCTWSQDGKYLWLTQLGGSFYRVNTELWEIDLEIEPPKTTPGRLSIKSVTLCSEGLAVLYGRGAASHIFRNLSQWTFFEAALDDPEFNYDRLVILDSNTGATRRSWYVVADQVIGVPLSELIFVSGSVGSPCLINTRTGELVNAIPTRSPKRTQPVTGRDYGVAPATFSADGLWVTYPRRGGHAGEPFQGFYSFRINGTRFLEESELPVALADKGTTVIPGNDVHYACRFYLSNKVVRTYIEDVFRQTALGELGLRVQSESPPKSSIMALETVSKTVFLARENSALTAVQAAKEVEFPMIKAPTSIVTSPARPGLLVTNKQANYWIEGGQPRPNWDFELPRGPGVLNLPTPSDDVVIPKSPLKGKHAADQVEYPFPAKWLDWAPDGKTFYMADGTNHLRHYDAEKQIELRQVPNFDSPQLQVTGSGLLELNSQRKWLRDLKTLRPLADLTMFDSLAGHRTQDLIAGVLGDVIVLFQAKTRKVQISTPLVAAAYQPGGVPDNFQMQLLHFFPDGQRLLARLKVDLLVVLHWPNGRIETERSIVIPPKFHGASLASIDPSGRFCIFGDQLIDLTASGNEFQGESLQNEGRVVFPNCDPRRGYFRDGNRNLWSIQLPGRKLRQVTSPDDGMDQTVPHPTERGRFLFGESFRMAEVGAIDLKLSIPKTP
ncbi:MAG: hypothetical protein JWM11_6608 [Planctomycetaceae bacterium]|nr:hypothetical protein [Planctomycetaceae bacterium]